MEVGGIVLLVILALAVIVVVWAIVTYNGLVRLRNLVQEAWRQVDVELRRRYDLIPTLVETVKGYAAHERATFEAVISARAAAQAESVSRAEQGHDETTLTRTLRGLLAVAEAYPELKADQHFRQLQSQLAETEDRIAAGRRFYNANVRAYNTRIDAFPSSVIAGAFDFEKAEYFEVEESAVRGPVDVSIDPA